MLSYSNTDCLNNPITDLAPVSFKGKISGNNCATFNGNATYILLGSDNVLSSSISKISLRFKLSSISSGETIFINFFKKETYGNRLYINSSTSIIFVYEGEAYEFNTGALNTSNWNELELSIENSVSLVLNGISYEDASPTTSTAIYNNTLIGANYDSSFKNYFYGSICDFKCYGSNNELLHWYPLAEGADTIAYDVIGSVNGRIVSTSITTFWNTKQDVFAYNAINGFGTISGSDAKIPLNLEGITYIKEYPNIKNGITPCESTIDFSQGVSNVAELNVIDPVIKIKAPDLIHNNFGADVGDGWTVGSSLSANTTIGNWRATYSGGTTFGVIYINNTTLSAYDISEGINYAVDISSRGNTGGNSAELNFACMKTNYSSLARKNIWVNFSFKIKPYQAILDNETYWEQINGTGPGSTNWLNPNNGPSFGIGIRYTSFPLHFPDGTPAYISSSNPRVSFKRLFNYNCVYGSYEGANKWITLHYNGPYFIQNGASYLGFGSGTGLITSEGACALADINFQILPLGTYNKVTDNGSISNLLLYKSPQTNTNLSRIQNHVDNY